MPEDALPDDLDLIAAANRGEGAALGALYERHRKFVHAVAWRMLGDGDLADEVVQDVFLWWIGRFPGFELTGRVTTFLYVATRNRAIDLAKRRRREPRGGIEGELLAGPPPSEGANLDDPRLAAALGRLTVGQQEVILLRFVHDLALAEIAEALELPVGTVKSRLHAATRTLREALEESVRK